MTSRPAGAPERATTPGRAVIGTARLTLGLCVGITVIAFESMAVTNAMPTAVRDLGADAYYTWMFSIFQAGMLFAIVGAGRLADRVGPVRPMLAGLLVFGVGLVVAGTASTLVQLIVARSIQGLGAGAASVTLYVLISRYYQRDKRPQVMSWISTAWVAPGLVGPVLAGWLTRTYGWRSVFLVVLPLLGLALVLVLPLFRRMDRGEILPVPEEEGETQASGQSSPIWAAGLTAAAVPLVQFAGQEPGWWSIPMLVAAVVMLAIALPTLLPSGVWRLRRGLGSVVVVRALLGAVFASAEVFTLKLLQGPYLLTPELAGLVLTISALGWAAGSFTQARWKLRRDQLMTVGTAVIAAGVALVAVIVFWQWPFWLIGAAWMITACGMGLAFASTSVATMALSPAAEQGRNASSLQLAEASGVSLLLALMGALYANLSRTLPANPAAVYGVLLAAMALLAVVNVLVSRRVGPVAHS